MTPDKAPQRTLDCWLHPTTSGFSHQSSAPETPELQCLACGVAPMNWDAIGATAEAIGALGVMMTLLYLALQTRQNTKVLEQTARMHETSTYRANIDGVMHLQAILAQDDQLALIWKKGLANESLQEAEIARFESYLNMYLFDQENKLYLTNVAALDEIGGSTEVIRHIEGQIAYLMESRYVRNWWASNAVRTFGPIFVGEVNRIAKASNK